MGFRDRLVERLGYSVEITEPFVPATENRGVANTAPAREAIVVNESTALSLVPVSRAISVLETAVMQIPVEVYRGNDKIPSPAWLDYPDVENSVSQSEWLGTTVYHMAVFGNAYWLIKRGPRGIVNITNIHPATISTLTDDKGKIYYSIDGKSYSNKDIVHLKLWKKPSTTDLLGEGPIQRHRSVLRSALDLHNYADVLNQLSA